MLVRFWPKVELIFPAAGNGVATASLVTKYDRVIIGIYKCDGSVQIIHSPLWSSHKIMKQHPLLQTISRSKISMDIELISRLRYSVETD